MTRKLTGRAGLLEILSWPRPHDSAAELAFCRELLDPIPGMAQDEYGNRMLRIGEQSRVLWSCHVDTVAARGGRQQVVIDAQNIARLRHGKAGMCLGADDGAGIWIMLGMIAARRPGLYIFHRGEERGCLGSRWIMRNRPKLLEGMEAAIAFDRAGCGDVITHQSHGRTCSDSFAASMAHALNALDPNFQYRPDNRGVFTDTNEYAGAIAECSNLSVGYQGQHGPRETLDVAHCEKLLAAMLKLDMSALVIERDALKPDHDGWGSGDPYRYERDELAQAAAHYPMVAARLLQECGITLEDFQFAVWGDDEPGYRPLMAS